MPRRHRLDEPGALHHVYARGIERRLLFEDDRDRRRLCDILSTVFDESGTRCLAWALMPNHYHVIVETGQTPISRVFHRVDTNYARAFNRRHDRVGYVFQGRFGSRRVDTDEYLLRVLAYVHLNPLTAGIVRTIAELEEYRWTGHAALMGRAPPRAFHDVRAGLERIDPRPERARAGIRGLLAECARVALDPDPRKWPEALAVPDRVEVDERVPGLRGASGRRGFIEAATRAWKTRSGRRAALLGRGWKVAKLVDVVSRRVGARPAEVRLGRRRRAETEARAIVAHVACSFAGETLTSVARATGVRPSAIDAARERGRRLLERYGLSPAELLAD